MVRTSLCVAALSASLCMPAKASAQDDANAEPEGLPFAAQLLEATARGHRLLAATPEAAVGAAALELLRLADEGQLARARADEGETERVRSALRAQLRLLEALESRAEAAERVAQAERALIQARRDLDALSPRPSP